MPSRELGAKGVKTPDGWSLFWAFNSEVHWVVPYDEDPVRLIDHAERGSRYDGQTGMPSNMQ